MKTTTDIYFAAALLSLGAKLEKTDKADVRHMEFEFSSPVDLKFETKISEIDVARTISSAQVEKPRLDLDNLETQWVNKTLQVNAFEFAEALKRMKSIVHSH